MYLKIGFNIFKKGLSLKDLCHLVSQKINRKEKTKPVYVTDSSHSLQQTYVLSFSSSSPIFLFIRSFNKIHSPIYEQIILMGTTVETLNPPGHTHNTI